MCVHHDHVCVVCDLQRRLMEAVIWALVSSVMLLCLIKVRVTANKILTGQSAVTDDQLMGDHIYKHSGCMIT